MDEDPTSTGFADNHILANNDAAFSPDLVSRNLANRVLVNGDLANGDAAALRSKISASVAAVESIRKQQADAVAERDQVNNQPAKAAQRNLAMQERALALKEESVRQYQAMKVQHEMQSNQLPNLQQQVQAACVTSRHADFLIVEQSSRLFSFDLQCDSANS